MDGTRREPHAATRMRLANVRLCLVRTHYAHNGMYPDMFIIY